MPGMHFCFVLPTAVILSRKKFPLFHYAKLSYELGYPDIALTEFRSFLTAISEFHLCSGSTRIIAQCTCQHQQL